MLLSPLSANIPCSTETQRCTLGWNETFLQNNLRVAFEECLSKNLLNHLPVHIGEAEVSAAVSVGEFFMIES